MVQLNDVEIKFFQSLKGSEGKILTGYLQRLVADAVDIRNIEGEDFASEIKARKLLSKLVEEGLINKLKTVNGQEINETKENYI